MRVRFAPHGDDRIARSPKTTPGEIPKRLRLSREEAREASPRCANRGPAPAELRRGLDPCDGCPTAVAVFALNPCRDPSTVLAKRSRRGVRDIAPRRDTSTPATGIAALSRDRQSRRPRHPGRLYRSPRRPCREHFYQSGLRCALVLPRRRDRLDMSCGAYLAVDNTIVPLPPVLPRLWVGSFYDACGQGVCGCDAGKLMAWPPMGGPASRRALYRHRFRARVDYGNHLAEAWIAEALKRPRARTISRPLGTARKAWPPSTPISPRARTRPSRRTCSRRSRAESVPNGRQKLLGRSIEGLCLSGAARCRVRRTPRRAHGRFWPVFIEPSCDDSGLLWRRALADHNFRSAADRA